MNGDLARCTRLLGAGKYPVGYKASAPVHAVSCPAPLELVLPLDRREWFSILTVSVLSGRRQDKYGGTALHQAANQGRLEVAQLLLASGADVNAKVRIASGYRLLPPPSQVGRRSNGTG